MGGGFGAAGLHSVLEPAAFGVPVLFGPHHANSRDADLLIEAEGRIHGAKRLLTARTSSAAGWAAKRSPARRGLRARRRRAGPGAADRDYDLVMRLVGR